jgi:hypothetical protein
MRSFSAFSAITVFGNCRGRLEKFAEKLLHSEVRSIRMADPERLELPTPAFEAQCSIQLSYGSDFFYLLNRLHCSSEKPRPVSPQNGETRTGRPFCLVGRGGMEIIC